MKTGDTVPVTIAGDTVAQAKVTEIDKDNNTVTLIVPATRVVMGLRVEIDSAPAPVEEPAKQTIITGVDRVDGEGNVIESASTDTVAAPVGESAAVGDTSNEGTPEGEATQREFVEPPVV